jgi:hypothetical protein
MAMKRTTLAGLSLFLVAILASSAALANGGYRHGYRSHAHFGFYFGAPAYWYSPAPYYYYPPAYYPAAPAQPTVYIERGNGASQPEQSQGQWYYCPEANAYYPYVKQCAAGWQKVPAQPQG